MPKLTILPIGVTIEAQVGQTVMEAAQEAGYYWPTTCGGKGDCTTCAGLIEQGAKNLTPMGRWETISLSKGRGRAILKSSVRLCCQARVQGDVTVKKPGVRLPE